jgi:hypothetical protein
MYPIQKAYGIMVSGGKVNTSQRAFNEKVITASM